MTLFIQNSHYLLSRPLSRAMAVMGLLIGGFVLSGCSTSPAKIGTAVDVCCATAVYADFEVTTQDLPVFLGPIIVSNFSVALAERGLQPAAKDAGLKVLLAYVQQNIGSNTVRDSFDERIEDGAESRFVAQIRIEMRDAKSEEIVWSGSLQRTHTVGPGEYMHTGRASVSFLESFRQVLSSAPSNKGGYTD